MMQLQRFALQSVRRSSTPSWLATGPVVAPSPTHASPPSPWNPATPPTPPPLPSAHVTVAVRARSSRSRRGLYDGKDVRFGNNVPFSMKKTRRRWNPNVQKKRVYSETLDEMVPFHITTSALRTIDKMGGLDQYLLRSKHVSTKGEGEGQRIRNRIVQKIKHREMLKTQAVARGESVEGWDKIVLVGKKIKQSSTSASAEGNAQVSD